MVKNLPLLLAMLSIGTSVLMISLTMQLQELVRWTLILIAVLLNIWSAIGLILHVGIQKLNRN
ncbi:hypothetical protein SAMN04487944_103118 [Gracilibacillus ureilyticus]|uniref:Uncharacterized protein n=1 Tax=Gracilibacillus ureilyticus TaxID=531814 RepID=A0A1H9NFE4_9BACI|nr:hypothetical protein [Gracilibacillus ureilyticus]SER34666.1 hypothetical protein SAMN04487944_103118 [Gracilibacillus ureilyticus]